MFCHEDSNLMLKNCKSVSFLNQD